MAFKKRWPSKRSNFRSRGPSTKTLARTKASKRYNWVATLDSACQVLELPPQMCVLDSEDDSLSTVRYDCASMGIAPAAPTRFGIVLPNSQGDPANGIAATPYEADDITIVRTVGYIDFQPFWMLNPAGQTYLAGFPSALDAAYANVGILGNRSYFFRAGLKKDQFNWNENLGEWEAPTRDPLNTTTWADGKFLKMWMKELHYGSAASFSSAAILPGSNTSCVGRVEKDAQADGTDPGFVLVTGSGTRVAGTRPGDPAITTTVEDCYLADPHVTNKTELVPTKPIRIPLSSRRRIRLSENEGLSLWVNYTVPYMAQSSCFSDLQNYLAVGFFATAHVKVLVET